MSNGAAEILEKLQLSQTAATTKALAEFVGDDPERLAALVRIFLKEHYRLAQRAAGVMVAIAIKRPNVFDPHLGKLIGASIKEDAPPVIRRNVVRLLQEIDVPKRLRATAFSHCVELVDDPAAETAVRAFAMTAAARIGRTEPALFNELVLVVEKNLPYETSPSYRRRAAKIIHGEYFE